MTQLADILQATRRAWAGELPQRYGRDWLEPFNARIRAALVPGISILDVGGGQSPSLAPEARPPGCHYVGLDSSVYELDSAPTGSYDEVIVADVCRRVPALEGSFDLAVSWQVLEHVKPLRAALDNIHAYLRPGGQLVALLSSSTSAFAVLNRVVPQRVGTALVARVMDRPPETVHPAHYDNCRHAALTRLLSGWSRAEIVPEYRGASYFGFSRFAQATYVAYEEFAQLGPHLNLATHYRIDATR
jgi:SAM-dependent methyltransferase